MQSALYRCGTAIKAAREVADQIDEASSRSHP
jgi:hypothetical protein